jgi:hypothetical protein
MKKARGKTTTKTTEAKTRGKRVARGRVTPRKDAAPVETGKKSRGRKPAPTLFVEKHDLENIWGKFEKGLDVQIKPNGAEDVTIRGKHLTALIDYMNANKRRKHTPARVVEYLHEESAISRNYARRVVATAINTGLVHPV